MSNEEYYLIATNEVDDNAMIQTLWAKSMALVEGDKDKARYKYINACDSTRDRT